MRVARTNTQDSVTTPSGMPETDSRRGDEASSTGGRPPFDELDLALIDALQTSPRAPWSQVGTALGIGATTAARRWHRLTELGLSWVTAYPTPSDDHCVAYVEVRCSPGAIEPLIDQLVADPRVFSLEQVAGDFDLFLSVVTRGPAALARFLSHDLGAHDGALSVNTRVSLRGYREGSSWRVRALDRDQRAQLGTRPAWTHPDASSSPDLVLLRALGGDGRRSYAELAAATGIAEPTARRRLQRMIRQGEILFRCDFAQQLAGWRLLATYRMNVPADRLDDAARELSALPDVRLCAAVTGNCNLLVSVWSRSAEETARLEGHFGERIPGLSITARTVTLRTVKRMGQLLHPDGTAAEHIPLEM